MVDFQGFGGRVLWKETPRVGQVQRGLNDGQEVGGPDRDDLAGA